MLPDDKFYTLSPIEMLALEIRYAKTEPPMTPEEEARAQALIDAILVA